MPTKLKTTPRVIAQLNIESGLKTLDYDWVFGVDEVGAGCLAGPLVTACFAYPLKQLKAAGYKCPVRVYDSKKISEKKRIESKEYLENSDLFRHQYIEYTPTQIDELNIYQARMAALAEAFVVLAKKIVKPGEKLLLCVDGPVVPKQLAEMKSDVVAESKGDQKYFAIAAASILAKTYRDNLMRDLAVKHPYYLWEKNVGYPTPDHKAALRKHGLTPLHRRSFNCS